jgi:hypothetical protein
VLRPEPYRLPFQCPANEIGAHGVLFASPAALVAAVATGAVRLIAGTAIALHLPFGPIYAGVGLDWLDGSAGVRIGKATRYHRAADVAIAAPAPLAP